MKIIPWCIDMSRRGIRNPGKLKKTLTGLTIIMGFLCAISGVEILRKFTSRE